MIVKWFLFLFFHHLISGLSASVQLNLDAMGICSFYSEKFELFEISNEVNFERNGEYRISLSASAQQSKANFNSGFLFSN